MFICIWTVTQQSSHANWAVHGTVEGAIGFAQAIARDETTAAVAVHFLGPPLWHQDNQLRRAQGKPKRAR